jgi:signal transduction histidine kinase
MTSKTFQLETDMKKIPGRFSSTSIFGTTILGITLAEGHAPIVRELAVPILRDGKIMTVPSVGNIPNEYSSNNTAYLKVRPSYNKHDYRVHGQTIGTMTVYFRVLARGGQVYWIEHICRSLFDTDNLYLGWQVSNPDITERKNIKAWIQERNRREKQLTQMLHIMQLDMARDQHDTIGQKIGFPRMKLDCLNKKSPPSNEV